jgi:hypothetical protein
MKIRDWYAIRVKAKKFEEVEFDNLVTEENLRQFLGHNIPRDKKTITKRGVAKKRSDAPPSPRPVTKKRPTGRAEETLEDVLLRKKRTIPLATSGAKITPPRMSMAGTHTEEGSASFRGFGPEVSPTRGAGSLPPFALRDESGSEASYRGSDVPLEETNAGASTTTSLVLERSEGEGELVPEACTVQTAHRVKHLARKKKFGARDRLAEIILEAERMWGRPVIRPLMPRRSDKNLPLRLKSMLKRGMRPLAPPKMKLSPKTWWKSILLGLLQQSVLELPHPQL